MTENPIRIFLIDDDEDEFVRVRDLIEDIESAKYSLDWTPSYEKGLDSLVEGGHDVYLIDYRLGERNGLELLKEALARGCTKPAIMLTGQGSDAVDQEAMRAGASDFLQKEDVTYRLPSGKSAGADVFERAIRHAVERGKILEELRKAHDYSRGIIDQSLDMIVASGPDRNLTEFNPAAEKCFGFDRDAAIGRPAIQLYADAEEGGRVRRSLETRGVFTGEVINRRKDGSTFPAYLSAAVMRNQSGEVVGYMGISRDITERKETERKLSESMQLLRESRSDMLSILDNLRMGVLQTNGQGEVVFLNLSGAELLGIERETVAGMHWERLLTVQGRKVSQLKSLYKKPDRRGERLAVQFAQSGGRDVWAEIEIQEDPRAPEGRILFMYDVSELYTLRRILQDKGLFENIVGASDAMKLVYEQILQLAQVDATVLIEGDTGTGKELVARAIHAKSARARGPFIPVNCAGLTDALVSSQLFGHRRGSFTGALDDQEGLFEAANGGTLFLDEIGDIQMPMQRALLRVLQEREITRVGDSKPRKVDVRVLAATNRDLNEAAAKGEFRPDLLYRIRVAKISLPVLRDRREDIPLLVRSFIDKAKSTTGKTVKTVSGVAMDCLLNYEWPGNVRELQNAVEAAMIRCKGSVLNKEDFPPEISRVGSRPSIRRDVAKTGTDLEGLREALEVTHGNHAAAARLLGIGRSTLYRRLKKFGLD